MVLVSAAYAIDPHRYIVVSVLAFVDLATRTLSDVMILPQRAHAAASAVRISCKAGNVDFASVSGDAQVAKGVLARITCRLQLTRTSLPLPSLRFRPSLGSAADP